MRPICVTPPMEQKYMLRSKKGQTGLGAGVWNLGVGSDPFGGPVRESIPILDPSQKFSGPCSIKTIQENVAMMKNKSQISNLRARIA